MLASGTAIKYADHSTPQQNVRGLIWQMAHQCPTPFPSTHRPCVMMSNINGRLNHAMTEAVHSEPLLMDC